MNLSSSVRNVFGRSHAESKYTTSCLQTKATLKSFIDCPFFSFQTSPEQVETTEFKNVDNHCFTESLHNFERGNRNHAVNINREGNVEKELSMRRFSSLAASKLISSPSAILTPASAKLSSPSAILTSPVPRLAPASFERPYGNFFEGPFQRCYDVEKSTLSHKALLVDAAGTLLEPAQPVTQVYLEIGRKYGVTYSEKEILDRYRHAYAKPWCHSILRYVDDARPFWQRIVAEATGCSDPQYSEEVYAYYTLPQAWRVCDPEAEEVFAALRWAGVKLAVVSNFDTRLRPLLKSLHCDHWFDALSISAEVQAEKPNPTIFLRACELLDVDPSEAVHVGDDRRNDVWGARDAGCDAWLWGGDVLSFREVAQRIGVIVPERLKSSV